MSDTPAVLINGARQTGKSSLAQSPDLIEHAPAGLENWFEAKAGVEPYQGGFLLHFLDKPVYPDVSATILTVVGVLVCALNLAFYGWQMWASGRR